MVLDVVLVPLALWVSLVILSCAVIAVTVCTINPWLLTIALLTLCLTKCIANKV